MDNMKEFYENAFKFFDEGIIREVYYNDDFCICNVSNNNYAFFPFPKTFLEKRNFKKNGSIGIFISKTFVPLLVNDSSYVKILISMNSQERDELTFRLNEESYLPLKKCKMQTDLNGPSKEIDFEMEKEIMGKSKSR